MLSDLALSSITGVMWGGLTLFLAGMCFQTGVERYSSSWSWAVSLTLIGIAAALGAIDHGFFEPVDHPDRAWFLVSTRVSIVLGSFFLMLATAQFFLETRSRRIVMILAGITGCAIIVGIPISDNFLYIMGYYAVGLIALLIFSLVRLRGWSGARWMVLGVVFSLVASVLAAIGFEGVFGLGVFGTYHVILMPAVIFFFLGGRAMRTVIPA